MIISVAELKQYITTTANDSVLEAKLQALELAIREYTNNNFQNRNIRYKANVTSGMILCPATYFEAGDTVQISESKLNSGIYTVDSKVEDADGLVIKGRLYDEADVLVTKVEYPADVKQGVIDIMDWKLRNSDKAGISAETISRYSVTYDRTSMNTKLGVPSELVGFLKPYMKAKF